VKGFQKLLVVENRNAVPHFENAEEPTTECVATLHGGDKE
jgi:hypothetical protein